MASDGEPSWHSELVALYEQGGGDAEAAKLLKITGAKFQQVYLEEPAFAEVIDMCRTLSRAWWESQARLNLWNKDFNTALWNFNMKNRYAWADKSEVKSDKNEREMSIDEVRSELLKRFPAMAKKMPELFSHVALVQTSRGDVTDE